MYVCFHEKVAFEPKKLQEVVKKKKRYLGEWGRMIQTGNC